MGKLRNSKQRIVYNHNNSTYSSSFAGLSDYCPNKKGLFLVPIKYDGRVTPCGYTSDIAAYYESY